MHLAEEQINFFFTSVVTVKQLSELQHVKIISPLHMTTALTLTANERQSSWFTEE